LIPAAGSGTRLTAKAIADHPRAPKQYLSIAGRPVLWHAVRAVCVPPVESVFVVLAPGDTIFASHDWSAFAGKLEPLYCGGETRRDSVYNGLVASMAAVEADDWMLVHDAARPCLPRKDLDSLMRETQNDEVGGILALPVAETVKKAAKDEGGAQRISHTEDRSQLWLAQTPQMFRAGLLIQALKRAKGAPTDEAAAVEQLGLKPRLVAGSRENLKVTWPEDLAIAESILKGRA
jgi:2-C-methyl-D-erythritol 4-phosphate cytidylyltransferase